MVRLVLTVLVVLLGVLSTLVLALLFISPGQPSPVTDERRRLATGSISEKIRVSINGIAQGMFIRGRDVKNPILLFVHGGAGMPEYFLAQRYAGALEVLEQHFTVCWWERRGTGLSWSPSLLPETMTVKQVVADLLAVTDYLRDRFGQQRIYLMAHSGGSFFALQAVAQSPQSFHAYIAVAQIVHQLRSENVAHQYMLSRFREIGDARMVGRLEAVPTPMSVPLPASYMAIRDQAMHRLGVRDDAQDAIGDHGSVSRLVAFSGLHPRGEGEHLARQTPIGSRAVERDRRDGPGGEHPECRHPCVLCARQARLHRDADGNEDVLRRARGPGERVLHL